MNTSGSVKVAVVARGEVARGGLAAMLAEAAHVGQYSVYEPEEFTAAAPVDAIQTLVLSCDVLVVWCVNAFGTGEDAWAAELAAVVRRNGIRVVLILPGAEVQRVASGQALPCDGVLDQDALTTEGLDDALRRLADGERLLLEAGHVGAVVAVQRPRGAAAHGAVDRAAHRARETGAGTARRRVEQQADRTGAGGVRARRQAQRGGRTVQAELSQPHPGRRGRPARGAGGDG